MNKPAAWMREDGVIAFHKQKEVDSQGYKWQPLYTHPVKELTDDPLANFKPVWQEVPAIKELTDEEINQIVSQKLETWNTKEAMVDFARAILRKAQE
tara:strand:- start:1864 stop:2154 length:291 start_codon:yes stop_codon:yes gene_type:complete